MSARKVRERILPGLKHLHRSRLRRCGCCGRVAFVLCLDSAGEWQRCLRCGANLRYEILAECLRREVRNPADLRVVELDPDSPLRSWLSRAGDYTRTYYAAEDERGQSRRDGARCEDVTRMTFPDASVDLLVSSEVLEHVPDLAAAGREIARVLRPTGRHFFTVPTLDQPQSIHRAVVKEGRVEHLVEPEYHGDPLDKGGILAFWSFGWDLPRLLDTPQIQTRPVVTLRGVDGALRRVVWETRRVEAKESSL